MLDHSFIDHVRVCCRAGKGGDGIAHFHREKFVPKGGPDGGDGGRGGHVVLVGDKQLNTLLHLRYRKHAIAQDGEKGGAQNKTGRQGEDLYLSVPLGTVAKDLESGQLRGEILRSGQTLTVASGGRGGYGNEHFKSPTDQAPADAEEGMPGDENWLVLELKLLADVGLVGYPNTGKSTLLSTLSAAKPEVADYPFTTISPQLGVVFVREDASFVAADLPGLITGASSGKGKGTRFLRHIERNAILLFVVSADDLVIQDEYQALLRELEAYDPRLLQKKRLLAITKADLLDQELRDALKADLPSDLPALFLSAVSEEGIPSLKNRLYELICEAQAV